MTILRYTRIPGDQPCQHPNCRSAPRGPRQACCRVEVGEARPVRDTLWHTDTETAVDALLRIADEVEV